MDSDRLQIALGRLEARRVEIERQIIADLESQFPLDAEGDREDSVTSLLTGWAAHMLCSNDHPTANDSDSTVIWEN
jgi:hypothetical protein